MSKPIVIIRLWLLCFSGALHAQSIFYTDAGDWEVKSADTSGMNVNIQNVVSSQPDLVPGKVAVDNTTNKIYFTDFFGDRILRAYTFSSFVEVLVDSTDKPPGNRP